MENNLKKGHQAPEGQYDIATLFKEELASLTGMAADDIQLSDALDEYGLDSINIVRLAALVGGRLGIDIEPSLFQDHDNVAACIEQLELLCNKAEASTNNYSLNNDCVLDSAIINNTPDKSKSEYQVKTALVTGGTGFIGAFLIAELAKQTDAKIICLVRAGSEADAMLRLKNNLQKYEIWDDSLKQRLAIVLGDLSLPKFGLTPEQFYELGKKIDTIFHSGAHVNFVYSYQHLKAANVGAVETVLQLAAIDKTKTTQVHFVSTLGVVMSSGYAPGELIYEDKELIHDQNLPNGYEQSKYVGDKIVQRAIKERNMPAAIYRLGLVSGDSNTGVYANLHEFLPSFLKGCLQLGSWPEVDASLEMVPVDFLCKAVVHIARNGNNLGKAYFALHPKPRPIIDIINFYREQGYKLDILPWEQWKQKLFNLDNKDLNDNALLPFIAFIKALPDVYTFFPKADKSNFLSATENLDYHCADQIELLKKYHQHFIEVGYYGKP